MPTYQLSLELFSKVTPSLTAVSLHSPDNTILASAWWYLNQVTSRREETELNTKVNTDDIFNLFFLLSSTSKLADYVIY